MNLNTLLNFIKPAWFKFLQIFPWVMVIPFLFSLFLTQEKMFALLICQLLIVWFFVEYFRIIQTSNHARKQYPPHDPKLWELEHKLEQRFRTVLGWAFLGGLGTMLIYIWKMLRE